MGRVAWHRHRPIPWADLIHLADAVEMVALRRVDVVHRERVSQGVGPKVRSKHSEECLDGLASEEVEHIPEQANIEFKSRWNRQEFLELLLQRRSIFGCEDG